MTHCVVRNGKRIAVETVEPKMPASPKRAQHGQHFVRVPLIWVKQLQTARCIGSYRVALHLLFQHWKSGGRPIKLSNVVLAELGVGDRGTKWRALLELERLGLIGIERHPKKSPVVTVQAV